ncbi:hypothetical protein [Halobacterium zhouii]|uniref:hypothetical protein n=1 Tax=Halobacterium zhouii TaxID=2902624 RepID=UPI001E449B55|nr:hypothetical protein [Halobacterium zhouii]
MRLVPVVCCVLIVLAGCQGLPAQNDTPTTAPATAGSTPSTAQTPAQTSTSEPTTERTREINVEGGTLPYGVNTVWTRVESMLGVDVGAPLTVRIENISADGTPRVPRFQRLLGVQPAPAVGPAGRTLQPGNIVKVDTAMLDTPTRLEYTLAHEYTHVVQFRTNTYNKLGRALDTASRDGYSVYWALVEGSATYVARQYERQYTTSTPRNLGQWYRNGSTTAKISVAPTYFGWRYLNATTESPEGLQRVYENPPRTTEELIHALPPDSEPPADLSVSVETDRQNQTTKRLGELHLRALLGTAVNESVAARAADGWGNDRRVAIGSGNETDYAWVHRWDDAANATEFEQGVNDYLAARGGLNASVRVSRVAPETTVLFVGSEAFVADVTASGTNETVTVRA